jgi:hypothetical protein
LLHLFAVTLAKWQLGDILALVDVTVDCRLLTTAAMAERKIGTGKRREGG